LPDNAIEFAGVWKRLGAKDVLRGVDLSVPRGECLVVIGRSGTGKSVLLNPTPQVKKVLDIVKVPELSVVFKNVQELDAYLDLMQKKVAEGD